MKPYVKPRIYDSIRECQRHVADIFLAIVAKRDMAVSLAEHEARRGWLDRITRHAGDYPNDGRAYVVPLRTKDNKAFR